MEISLKVLHEQENKQICNDLKIMDMKCPSK